MSVEDDVRTASEGFYSALNRMLNGDAGPMDDVWSHEATVTTMHPIGGRETGWNTVRDTWQKVSSVCSDGDVRLDDRYIQVAGDAAYELGVERGGFSLDGHPVKVEARATNVYRRSGDGWKIVHHHSDLTPAMVQAMGGGHG